ncbi:hypothetical protein LY76DRAFT_348810 [Colletotrichum caudatum]|nr:hypothetical protein LY76DRAFT_348810 [Colletotrichum caudatum]
MGFGGVELGSNTVTKGAMLGFGNERDARCSSRLTGPTTVRLAKVKNQYKPIFPGQPPELWPSDRPLDRSQTDTTGWIDGDEAVDMDAVGVPSEPMMARKQDAGRGRVHRTRGRGKSLPSVQPPRRDGEKTVGRSVKECHDLWGQARGHQAITIKQLRTIK